MSARKYYIVGPEPHLRRLFPDYTRRDERRSNDGRLLLEMELSEELAGELLNDDSIALFNHQQVLAFLDSEPEKWGGAVTRSVEYSRAQLEKMTKAQLVEIAEAKDLETDNITKAELIEALLEGG